MGLSHSSLEEYYGIMLKMKQEYNFSISEFENLIPYELDLFIMMLNKKGNKGMSDDELDRRLME